MYQNDTITGIATATGIGGIAIIRVSGKNAENIMNKVFSTKAQKPFKSHKMYYGFLMDDNTRVDECMAVIMRVPKSYTCEDVFELHTHGGHEAAHQALRICIEAGARLAEPGEFTKRAFLNGRIDLSQSEAVMAMISANGESALKAASQQLEGMQSKLIQDSKQILIKALSGIEAAIDYPEEIEDTEAFGNLIPDLEELKASMEDAIDERSARIVRDGLQVVLCGNPNAGKSTLFNMLLSSDRAIVTDIPGTTRDLIHGSITLNGILINLIDTAGIRETDDPIEKIGVERAKKVIENADVVMLVVDGCQPLHKDDLNFILSKDDKNNAVIITKGDLPSLISPEDIKAKTKNITVLQTSSINQSGLKELKEFLAEKALLPKTLFFTHTRHLDAAKAALSHIEKALEGAEMNIPLELISVDLKEALHYLGEITGESVNEELIDSIFANFCVGK